MQLSAVILARVLAFVESIDLNPRGNLFLPGIVPQVVERYKFLQFPQTAEQFDETKGIAFAGGKLGDKVIDKFVIWNSLLVLETRSSTADSKKILEEILTWGAEKFGLNYKPEMIKRFAYVSDLSFYSEVPILDVSPAFAKLAIRTSNVLTDIWQEPVRYEPLNLSVGHDPMSRKYQIAPFTITRRAEAPFSENKYFSEAPLPTDKHLELLQEFEEEIMRAHQTGKK